MLRETSESLRWIAAKLIKYTLPENARLEARRDRLGLPLEDPGIEKAIELGARWLGLAQDCSTSHDGGVSARYSLIEGWAASYPETTGYIAPTMLAYAGFSGNTWARQRAQRMLDWLVSIQFPDGCFQADFIGIKPPVPATFNTGQILLGLVSGVREFGDIYREPMIRAADWLVRTQDKDGAWRKNQPGVRFRGEKAYDTHVAWALLEAARLEPDKPYADAAIANVSWALTLQRDNGWFERCCTGDPTKPLTHTLGYALRGILELYRFNRDTDVLESSRRTADGILGALREDGFLPGRLYPDWRSAANWACLTGSVQIAICFLMLFDLLGDERYRDAAYVLNRYVRRSMMCEGSPEKQGAIKGAFPVDGGYLKYEYPNWACKFFVDANMLEKAVREKQGA
jgi:hypothetical protein